MDKTGGLMTIYLETERMILRQFTCDDLNPLAALNSDSSVMQYLTGGKPIPRPEVEGEVLPRYLQWHKDTPDYGYWVAEHKETGEFLGWFHLRLALDIPDESQPELGYRLMRRVWGQGYATEGSRALVRHAFEALGVERVVATTMAVNVGSRRVMEKAGLRHVSTFCRDWADPIPGSEHGEVVYALSRSEYRLASDPVF